MSGKRILKRSKNMKAQDNKKTKNTQKEPNKFKDKLKEQDEKNLKGTSGGINSFLPGTGGE